MRIAKLALLLCLSPVSSCNRKPPPAYLFLSLPVISPDGKSVAFTADTRSRHDQAITDLVVLDLRTDSPRTLIRSQYREILGKVVRKSRDFHSLCWSPNGKAIFATAYTGHSPDKIWKFSLPKGRSKTIIASDERSHRRPRISPDGKWLICRLRADLIRAKPDGTSLTLLTNYRDVAPFGFDWAPNGYEIYLIRGQPLNGKACRIWKIDAGRAIALRPITLGSLIESAYHVPALSSKPQKPP